MHSIKKFTVQTVCARACLTGQKMCAVQGSMLDQCLHRSIALSMSIQTNKKKQNRNTKKLSRICFNKTIYAYNRLKSKIPTFAYQIMVKVHAVQYVCDIKF